MKFIQNLTKIHQSTSHMAHAHRSDSAVDSQVASTLRADTVARFSMLMKHPRSLARPTVTWRPPSLKLVGLHSTISPQPHLVASISRRRIGPNVKARLKGFGVRQQPAYLMSVRISDSKSNNVSFEHAEQWMLQLVGPQYAECIHMITDHGQCPVFVWIVGGDFQPLPSPASMFQTFQAAA